MSSALLSLPELFKSYKSWLIKNPKTASEYETTAKWISYFIAGRVNNSQVVSELVYSLSNLLVLFNDRIISNANRQEIGTSVSEQIKIWLSILEYCEVFFELSAEKYWGKVGRWIIIVSVQVFKCISRMLLVFHYNEPIIQNPPLALLQRDQIGNTPSLMLSNENQSNIEGASFTLRRSGRVVRKVDASPPISLRTWKPLEQHNCDNKQMIEPALLNKQLLAETLYIVKPIVHLSAVACCGTNTWKPWMLSLFLDLYSLRIYRECKKADLNSLTPQQRLQISRRAVGLLLYLLRSPFYERHSKNKIEALLLGMSKNVPLVRLVCSPLLKYLPFWQRTYFYMWST